MSLTVYGNRSAVCYLGEHAEIMRIVWGLPSDVTKVRLR